MSGARSPERCPPLQTHFLLCLTPQEDHAEGCDLLMDEIPSAQVMNPMI